MVGLHELSDRLNMESIPPNNKRQDENPVSRGTEII